MKVSVLGAGAIGSMLGGLLQHHRPDSDVRLIVRGEHGRAIQERGSVELVGPWGTYDVPITASNDVADIAGSDYVLLTVKSQATDEALVAARDHLGDAIVISIQNGINDERLLSYLPAERLVMGMTATNMAVLEPGRVHLQLDGTTIVGPSEAGGDEQVLQRATELLRATRMEIGLHPNVLGIRYNKLAINAMGYASCISQSNFITEAVCHPPWRRLVGRPILEECIRTFERAGVKLDKIPGRPDVYGLRRFLRLLDVPLVGAAIRFGAERTYNRKPIVFSLYQDLKRGKATEVDYINGQIVRLAARHGAEAPFNQCVVELVHELEQLGPGTFRTREEVLDRFRQLTHPTAATV